MNSRGPDIRRASALVGGSGGAIDDLLVPAGTTPPRRPPSPEATAPAPPQSTAAVTPTDGSPPVGDNPLIRHRPGSRALGFAVPADLAHQFARLKVHREQLLGRRVSNDELMAEAIDLVPADRSALAGVVTGRGGGVVAQRKVVAYVTASHKAKLDDLLLGLREDGVAATHTDLWTAAIRLLVART